MAFCKQSPKIHIFIIALFYMFIYPAYAEQSAIDNNVTKVNDAIEQYKREAATMSSAKIHEEVESIQETIRLLPGKNLGDHLSKATGFLLVLEERRKANQPSAAFYFGLFQLKICRAHVKTRNLEPTTQKLCKESIDSFAVAVKGNDARAMAILGKIYKEGLGVNPSKLVAADWFLKSAKQYQIENSREGALSAIEEAVNLVPDYHEALAFRKKLLNEKTTSNEP